MRAKQCHGFYKSEVVSPELDSYLVKLEFLEIPCAGTHICIVNWGMEDSVGF